MGRYFLHIKHTLFVLFFTWNGMQAQDYDYIQYTTKNGLPTNYVYGVVEDDEGFIWAFTENGLSKFDGYTFQNYTGKDGLPGNDIVNARNVGGKIWLQIYKNKPAYLYKDSIYSIDNQFVQSCTNMWSFDREICYICGEHIHINPVDMTIERRIGKTFDATIVRQEKASFRLDSVGRLDDLSPNTHHVIEGDTVRYYTLKEPFSGPTFKNGYVYYFSESRRIYWKKDNKEKSFLSDKNIGNNVFFIQLGRSEKYIIHDYLNVKVFLLDIEEETIIELDVTKGGLKSDVHILITVRDSTYFVMSEKGFLEYNFDSKIVDKFQCNLSEKYFTHRFYKDKKGNIWVGSRDGGLFMLPASKRKTQIIHLSNPKDKVFEQFVKTSQGSLLGITDNSGVYLIDDNTIKNIFPPNPRKRFRSAVSTPHGAIMSSGQTSYLIEDSGEQFSIQPVKDKFNFVLDSTHSKLSLNNNKNTLDINNRSSMTYNPKKQSIYSSFHVGIGEHRFTNTNNIQVYYGKTQTTNTIYYHTYQDKIYVGNAEGVYLFEDYDLISFITDQPYLKNVTTFYGNTTHLWIGTESHGLYHFDLVEKQLTPIIPATHIRHIRPDTDSTLLVASNDGVFVIPKGNQANFKINNYTVNDGLPTNEIYDIYTDSIAQIHVASSEGLNLIGRNKNHFPLLNQQDLHVTKFTVENETFPCDSSVKQLEYTADNIEIQYYMQSYASNGVIRYFTKLSPSEAAWRATNERSISYVSLPSGHYTFHLKARDIYGNEVEHPPIKFHIKAAIWQTFGFWMVIGLLIIGVIVQYFLHREKENRRQLEKEKEMNRRMAELELSALRAQMNPHFIFNALGSIQYYIQLNEIQTADDYLTRFARLMRQYLESSKEKMISLSDEIQLLELYTGIEQLRFEDLFSVHIHTDEQMQIDNYYLPSMLIQPYIENAINHGLSERRDGKGKLSIRFYTEDELLCCEISDNGIGRKNAEKNKRSFHKSRGMSIIADRIYTLERSEIAKVDVQISDCYPEEIEFPGTQVNINIKHLK